jgi:hypothetical protein
MNGKVHAAASPLPLRERDRVRGRSDLADHFAIAGDESIDESSAT